MNDEKLKFCIMVEAQARGENLSKECVEVKQVVDSNVGEKLWSRIRKEDEKGLMSPASLRSFKLICRANDIKQMHCVGGNP